MRVIRSETVGEATLLLPMDGGAGDFVTLLHAALRLTAADVTIDLVARAAWRGSRRLPLTPREFGLLAVLARRPGTRVTRRALFEDVWGRANEPGSNLVEVHLCRLRAKLADAGGPPLIETLPDGGWRLRVT